MKFSVSAAARGAPPPQSQVVLQRDLWDDFGYKTQYSVYYFESESALLIGSVKILQKGQGPTESSLLQIGPISPLPDDFCSLGQSLDYYERLAALPTDIRNEILHFLQDALIFPDHAKLFEDESGWRTSITRDLDISSYRPLALTLLERDYNALPSKTLQLTFTMAGWNSPLTLDFNASNDDLGWVFKDGQYIPSAPLPERVAVLTGRNGSGKSTLLARLARVLHASQGERGREVIQRLGRIEPIGIGFSRIITVSYSAFDTFQVPGVSAQDRKQIISDIRQGTGRYVFAGLRDIARELEENLAHEEREDAPTSDKFILDRQERTYLKSADQLAEEYARMIERIFTEARIPLLYRALNILIADPSFSDIPDQSAANLLQGGDPREMFMGWSTGHKIVMHTVATLVAHAQPKSIILMDEPESHLHPPLLAALMHSLRIILDRQDAFAVIATHSPVVAQETLGKHVSVVNRSDESVNIVPPKIETYGESIGEITNEVFGLTSGSADFHSTLRSLVERGRTLEQINSRFERGLSLQARAFVMSLLPSDKA